MLLQSNRIYDTSPGCILLFSSICYLASGLNSDTVQQCDVYMHHAHYVVSLLMHQPEEYVMIHNMEMCTNDTTAGFTECWVVATGLFLVKWTHFTTNPINFVSLTHSKLRVYDSTPSYLHLGESSLISCHQLDLFKLRYFYSSVWATSPPSSQTCTLLVRPFYIR